MSLVDSWMCSRGAYSSTAARASAPYGMPASASARPRRSGSGASKTERTAWTSAAAAGCCPAPTARHDASRAMRRWMRVPASCSKEKTTACRPVRTALRTICSAIVVLPDPSLPPSRTSSPERRPPSRVASSRSNPVGQTVAPGRAPRRSDASASSSRSCTERRRSTWRALLAAEAAASGLLLMEDMRPLESAPPGGFDVRSQRAMPTYLVSRYSSIPSNPPSRPKPDCLTPPNGAAGLDTIPVLTPIIPNSMASATRIIRFWSLV